MKKKLVWLVLTLVLIAAAFLGATTLAEDDITVELDGEVISFDVSPKLIDKRTMVPMRKIFEEIGATVKWDEETQTVSARRNKKTVTLTIDEPTLKIDKGDLDEQGNPIVQTVDLDAPPQLISQRTLVPVRAISEAFGLDVSWDAANNKVLISSGAKNDSQIENKASINLSDLTVTGKGAEIEGNQITITSGGDYTINGTLNEGNIVVSTKENVTLNLSDASITTSEGPCIFVEEADDIHITLTGKNYLDAKNSEDGAIYSKEDLTIQGKGALDIKSAKGHAIKASDNLTIESGTMILDAFGDGIHINDTFEMTDGALTVTSIGDGIDSESIVNIAGGTINIKTNGTPTVNTADEVDFEKSSKGIKAVWMLCINGGEITVGSASHAIDCDDAIEITGGSLALSSEYEKGITAEGNLLIDGKTNIDITKATEGIESKNILTINNGNIKIIASDDAINATGGVSGDMQGMFGGGRQNAAEPPADFQMPAEGEFTRPEGESARPQRGNRPQRPDGQNMPPEGEMPAPENIPQNGEMPQRPARGPQSNENMPQAEGNAPQQMPPREGGMMQRENMKDCLIINGGEIEIYGGDDCLDANGNLVINGGTIKATKTNGSFAGVNGIIDPDGQTKISEKATLIFAAGAGNDRGLSINQNSVTLYCDTTHKEGETITLKDENGNTLYEYTPAGNFGAVLIASDKLELEKTYTITIGNETHEIVLSEQKTVVGTNTSGNRGSRFW